MQPQMSDVTPRMLYNMWTASHVCSQMAGDAVWLEIVRMNDLKVMLVDDFRSDRRELCDKWVVPWDMPLPAVGHITPVDSYRASARIVSLAQQPVLVAHEHAESWFHFFGVGDDVNLMTQRSQGMSAPILVHADPTFDRWVLSDHSDSHN